MHDSRRLTGRTKYRAASLADCPVGDVQEVSVVGHHYSVPMHEVRLLTREEMASAAFRQLLWFSVEVDDDALDRILEDEIPRLRVIGVIESAVVGFAAYRQVGKRSVIEYIAVAEARRGQKLGSLLIKVIAVQNPGSTIYAQTDDDAVEFYRASGFQITPGDRDSRWPERQRYDCILEPA